ncbi:MAG: FAD:protein FMN transferase [Terriglobia bacterium]
MRSRHRVDRASSADPVRREGCVYAMGTLYRVVAYGADVEPLESAVAEALTEAERLDRMLSNYRPESELSQLNQVAAHHDVRASDELFELLSVSFACSRESEGTFDITVGPLTKAWGFYKDTGHYPHPTELQQALDKVGYWQVLLDPQHRTVRFARHGVELDPGGIGKGYAVDKMALLLGKRGVDAALISAGGSTIYGLGAPPNKPGWAVSIRDPRNPSQSAATVTLKDQSLSTSGNYEKFFWAEGRIWSHIVDPRTGYPTTGTLSVSVIAPRTIDSEIWAKPYYIMGRDWTEKHKSKTFRVLYCEERSNPPCAWLE